MEIKYNKSGGDAGTYIEVYNSFHFNSGEISGKRGPNGKVFKNFLSNKSKNKIKYEDPHDYDRLVKSVRGIAEIIYAHLNIDFIIKRNVVKNNKIDYSNSDILYYDACGKNMTPKSVAKPNNIDKESIKDLADLISKSMYFSVYYYLLLDRTMYLILKNLTGAKDDYVKKKKHVKFYSKYEKYDEEEIKDVLYRKKIDEYFLYMTDRNFAWVGISSKCQYVEDLIDAVLKSINRPNENL